MKFSVLSNSECLQDQERSLVGAIARLAEASDVASGKY
jgi:hypothetical protein